MKSLKRMRILSENRQIDVFNKTGIWPARLSMLENGLLKPRQEEVDVLAKLYKVDVEDLLEV